MSVRRDKIQLEVEINGQKAGQTYGDLTKRATALKRELRNLTPGTEAFINKSKELKTVNDQLADIRSQTRGVAQAQKEATSASGGLISKLKGLAPVIATAFGVQAIGRWLTRMKEVALQLDSNQRKFRIVFGDAGNTVTEFARLNSRQLGITIADYEALAARIGDILIPMGFQREEAAKLSADLVNLSGALAEWSGGQLESEEVTQILTKALTGEREGLKQLGIVISEADVQNELLVKGQKELTGAALEQAKAQATLDLIYRKSADAQASFVQNQDSAGRAISRINAFFREQRDLLGQAFLPLLTSVSNAFANIVAPAQRASDITRELQVQFNNQIETLRRANLSQEARRKLIEQINGSFGEYSQNLLTEKSTLEDIAKFQESVNTALQERILIQAATQRLQEVTSQRLEAVIAEVELQERLTELQKERQNAPVQSDLTGGGSGNPELGDIERRIRRTEAAITKNQELQEELRRQYESTSNAAKDLGVDLIEAFGGGTGTTGGSGTPIGAVNEYRDAVTSMITDIKAELNNLNDAEGIDPAELEKVRELNRQLAETEAFFSGSFGLNTDADIAADILNIQRNASRELNDLLLEDQEERRRILLEEEQAILEARLAAYEIGSQEYLAIERQITENEIAQSEARIQNAQREADAKRSIAQLQTQAATEGIDQTIAALSADEQARKKNFGVIKALQASKVLINLPTEISGYFERFAPIPGGQIIAGILSAAATARALTAASKIRSQGFYRGGYTGDRGIYSDSQGAVAGVVHTNEWVGPQWMVNDPQTGSVIRRLEAIRKSKGGYAEGGFAGLPSTAPVGASDLALSQAPSQGAQLDMAPLSAELRQLASEIRQGLSNMRAYVVYEDIEDASEEINTIRQRSAL